MCNKDTRKIQNEKVLKSSFFVDKGDTCRGNIVLFRLIFQKRNQFLHGSATMTDVVFGVGIHLGKGLREAVGQKNRVVSKAVFAAATMVSALTASAS